MDEILIWIGVRESDINDTKHLFQKSITIFGSGENGNIAMEKSYHKRYNHNSDMPEYSTFFQAEMNKLIEQYPSCKFVCYDAFDTCDFSADIQKRISFSNSYSLLAFLNNKIQHKLWMKDYVDVLPYKIVYGSELTKNYLEKFFPASKEIVIQSRASCGGEGTFYTSVDSFSKKCIPLYDDEQYFVTEYQQNNIPINVHAVIYKDQVVLFPPSIQLISKENNRLKYIGSDFCSYQSLSDHYRQLVNDKALLVCYALREKGYLGVCGIDMIISNESCYFMEINARFQASTAILNQGLSENGCAPVHLYHIESFLHNTSHFSMPTVLINKSLINYHYTSKKEKYLKWLYLKLKQSSEFSLRDDSVDTRDEIEEGSYLYQLNSNCAISCITFQNCVRLHPNVKISLFEIDTSYSYDNLIKLKTLLLSRGVSFSPALWDMIGNANEFDWEEFGAVTLLLFDQIWITSPCFELWHTISPLEIDYDCKHDKPVLKFYGEVLFPIEIMGSDHKSETKTKNGHYLKDIVYMNPDRLRIYHRNGCALQDGQIGCKFCDLYGVDVPFTFEELCEAASYYFNDSRVKHFLIGGGSGFPSDDYSTIINLASFIYQNSGKHIYLMSQPIDDANILNLLKESGVSEIAFNIEMFDRDLAKILMPGKARNTLSDYYKALKLAVEQWGNTGNVRSVILLGFDDINVFKQGIYSLCLLGVAPILSLFRPCPGTPLANYMPLDETETLYYFEIARSICDEFNIKLGPSCKACQNNTVALEL